MVINKDKALYEVSKRKDKAIAVSSSSGLSLTAELAAARERFSSRKPGDGRISKPVKVFCIYAKI